MDNNKTYRIFSLVCYDESDNLKYEDLMSLIIKNNINYFSIYHNKDNNKPHYHISLYFEKPTTLTALSNKLKIDSNYISYQDEKKQRYTLKSTIGYLIHYNNKEKYQYNLNDIRSNNYDLVNKYYTILTGGSDEKNELSEIIAFIEDNNCNATDLLKFCIDMNYLKTFKKYNYILYNICKRY